MNTRVLFLVNGLGLGNSTRCHGVIQSLHRQGVEIQVVTSGNGLWYFKDKKEVSRIHENESFNYASSDQGQISILGTLASSFNYLSILKRNVKRIDSILEEWSPHVVVTDSDYTSRPMKRRNIPIAALNNADMVVQQYRKFKDRPSSIRAQYLAVERMDYLYQRQVPDIVLSPSLDPSTPPLGPRCRRIGPMVRDGFMGTTEKHRASPKKVVIMLSGSSFGSPVQLRQSQYPVEIDVVGRAASWDDKETNQSVRFHGKISNTIDMLREADLVVVNGGFSAVSEMFCLKKPMVVIPVPNHAEQWINGRTIQHLGVGTMAEEEHLEQAMLAALEKIDGLHSSYKQLPPIPDGAKQAADNILALV
jgi:UDP:flavonoid glycosyltransferase YjiC (YdhE family)